MDMNQSVNSISERDKQLDRILVAIRDNRVFLFPPLDIFLLGKKPWSLNPNELAVLSMLSEYGMPVVAEELNITIDTLESMISSIYTKLQIMNELNIGSFN